MTDAITEGLQRRKKAATMLYQREDVFSLRGMSFDAFRIRLSELPLPFKIDHLILCYLHDLLNPEAK